MAAAMSHECGMVEAAEVDRLRRLLERVGLPVRIEGVTPEVALEHMRIDKKALGGRMRLILLRSIGESFVTADYPEQALQRTLSNHFG
jgi:3-dehydroquinate synthase